MGQALNLRMRLGLVSGVALVAVGLALAALGDGRAGWPLVLLAAPCLPLLYAVRVLGWWDAPPTLGQRAAAAAVLACWSAGVILLIVP